MNRPGTRRPGRSLAALFIMALLASTVVLVSSPAHAERQCGYKEVGGKKIWTCWEVDPGTPGDPGDGGTSEPTCDLSNDPYTEYCIGEAACWGNDPAAVQDPKELEGVPKPSEDAHVVYKECRNPDGSTFDEWSWSTDDGPSTADRIRAARAALSPPTFEATFNPPGRTFVNLDTWWWAEGAPQGRITGGEALGVRGIATPDRMVVEPGDGSPAFSCPITTSKSDACSYTYRRSSVHGDYQAVVRILYTVSFEADGEPLDVAGMPAEFFILEGRSEVAVPVREIQSRVTDVG